jgi:hypothetical protein
MVRNLDQYSNPVPFTGAATPYTHHINYQQEQHERANLKRMFRR